MSGLTDKFLFDVIVLVATLQSATLERQFQLADERIYDNQFCLAQLGQRKKRGGDNFENFQKDQSNTWLKASSTITQYRHLNFNLIARKPIQHNSLVCLTLKHYLYFKLLHLVINFSLVSKNFAARWY